MSLPAVSIPDDQPERWLDRIGALAHVRAVELPLPYLLERRGQILPALERLGFAVVHATRLLPPGFARHYPGAGAPVRERLLGQVRDALAAAAACGVRHLTLDLDLHAPETGDWHAQWVALVRQLLPAAVERGLTLNLPLHHPPVFPGSREWNAAANLAAEVMHPACAFELNLDAGEIQDGFDFAGTLRELGFHLNLLRIHFTPAMGEDPSADQLQEWSRLLQHQGFKGAVIFCPRVTSAEGIPEACAMLDRFAEFFHA